MVVTLQISSFNSHRDENKYTMPPMRSSTSDWTSSACGTPDETGRHASTTCRLIAGADSKVVPTGIAE